MKNIVIVTVLATLSFSAMSSEFIGRDLNGNECSIQIVKDTFIQHETPERRLWPSYEELSTTERITKVNFAYLKSGLFSNKKMSVRGYTVDNRNNNVYGGYSFVKSSAQSSERVNSHLGIDGMELKLRFDHKNRTLISYEYGDMYDESDVAVSCRLIHERRN